ncbi:MAG: hypothetical protein LBM69_06455 [Lachnospiraceae bacterium]|nr:hypothetical protein [Lachnospiraceae bacterium]
MKYTRMFLVFVFVAIMCCVSCSSHSALSEFREKIDAFCVRISQIDTAINDIDPLLENATAQLLSNLDELEMEFREFAAVSFPEEFDYLEKLSDDASAHMTDAVTLYHTLYGSDSYDEEVAATAKEYYSRSYQCIQVIITFLHGEEPNDPDFTIEYIR